MAILKKLKIRNYALPSLSYKVTAIPMVALVNLLLNMLNSSNLDLLKRLISMENLGTKKIRYTII
jgi:hypothetical protein